MSIDSISLFAQATSSSLMSVMTVGDKDYTLQDLFSMGGAMMWPILVLSVLSLCVMLLCIYATRPGRIVSRRFMDSAESLIAHRDLAGLERMCIQDTSCMASIVLRVLGYMSRVQNPVLEDMRETASAEGARQAGGFMRKISWLSDIGSVAPMFGLLGTVTGMIRTFFEISAGNFEGVKQMQMAGGVAEALITTAAGLMVAIPTLLVYAYFRGVVQKNLANLESASTHIVTLLSFLRRRSPSVAPMQNAGSVRSQSSVQRTTVASAPQRSPMSQAPSAVPTDIPQGEFVGKPNGWDERSGNSAVRF